MDFWITRKTVWNLGKGRRFHSFLRDTAIAEVIVEEKLVGGVELLTVSGEGGGASLRGCLATLVCRHRLRAVKETGRTSRPAKSLAGTCPLCFCVAFACVSRNS